MKFLNLIFVLLSPSFTIQALEYTTVNSIPQFSSDENRFAVYWAVWVGFSEEEITNLAQGGEGALVSKRDIGWQVYGCEDRFLLHENSESFYYFDSLRVNDKQKVVPIPEANREDYRYINMLTFSSLQTREVGRMNLPKRGEFESAGARDRAYKSIKDKWREKSNIVGTYGRVLLTAHHKLFYNVWSEMDQELVTIGDYKQPGSELYDLFAKYAPSKWPIYYDERAHKPHHLLQPSIWSETPAEQKNFKMTFVWNWCEKEIEAKFIIPSDGLPGPGPNRPGRVDLGVSSALIEIVN